MIRGASLKRFSRLLQEGDLRTVGNVNKVIELVSGQKDFDLLFDALLSNDRKVVMRAADAIEKITIVHPEYLKKHRNDLLNLMSNAKHKELKWHIAQLIPRLRLKSNEVKEAWKQLYFWVGDKNESRIVRVNSLDALFELAFDNPRFTGSLDKLVLKLEREKTPSLIARLKKLRKNFVSSSKANELLPRRAVKYHKIARRIRR